jgi:predicted amidophosphoribosyltransferase
VRAIAMKERGSPLERTIIDYKYYARWGWSLIFARLLLGWLERTLHPHDVDLIVAAPTYIGPPKWRFPHTEAVIDSAAVQDVRGLWPFDQNEPRAIVATGQRSQSAGSSLAGKQVAAAELAAVLLVPDPARVIGKRVLVYDDVLTSGETLNAIAGALRRVGAAEVSGVVLARQAWST